MTLLTRVIRLESVVKPPTKPVSVVFQCKDESDEKVLSRAQAENDDPESILIMVKFVEPIEP